MEGDKLHAAAGKEGARGAKAGTPSSRKHIILLLILLVVLRGIHTPPSDHEALGFMGGVMADLVCGWREGMHCFN